MDLGCIDMGCVEKPKKETNSAAEIKDDSPNKESANVSASKLGKNNRAKDAVRSSLNALNKLASQITKPPHRKTSPLNWFPRKKVEPYLKRKIKMLQEVDGMHSTLDETLGDSNPHYCRVLREKIAIREAAEKAMEARKAAMVEASWCRILQAARIDTKEAEAQLLKAEDSAAEAFQAARAVGVIMSDTAENHYKFETVLAKGGSTTDTVSANFETAFEVDKQVAAAVKAAFVKLANCPSINKEEFKELLRRISENPDTDENFNNDLSDLAPECESDVGSELDKDSLDNQDSEEESDGVRLRKHKKRRESDKFSMNNIMEMMLGRLKCLKEDELASLATIVATCGLNAALDECENKKQSALSCPATENTENAPPLKAPNRMSISGKGNTEAELPATENTENAPPLKAPNRMSISGKGNTEAELPATENTENAPPLKAPNRMSISGKGNTEAELPSLDKFLVKRLTRLEREVLEAKNAKESNVPAHKLEAGPTVPDLGSVLVKHTSKLEKEVEEAKVNNNSKPLETNSKKFHRGREKEEVEEIPSLDKFLVKRLTRFEREVQEARNRSVEDSKDKKNKDLNKIRQNPHHKVKEDEHSEESNFESLDKVLVKHVSRLEREKMEFRGDEQMRTKLRKKDVSRELEKGEGSLDQVLVKHKSRLEREKMAAFEQQEDGDKGIRHSVSRKQAREQELQASWGGLSLGNSMRPRASRLEREKAAWIEAEEEERKRAVEGM